MSREMNGYCTMAIIPARYGSVRLPGKPLLLLNGKSLIQRVCERVAAAKSLDHFCVATDDIRIYNHVKKLGYDVIMTRLDQPSGTFRCAEVLEQFPMVTHIVNVQGDEPLVDPAVIDILGQYIIGTSGLSIATLVRRIGQTEELTNPAVVKAVINQAGEAMYFSRQPIPYVRDFPIDQWLQHGAYYRHIGLYAYTSQALRHIEKLSMHPFEAMEKLEQLTWLANGLTLRCLETDHEAVGIDTEEDLKRVGEMIRRMEQS